MIKLIVMLILSLSLNIQEYLYQVEYGDMSYDEETIARLETLLDHCLEYEIEGISIFHSDAQDIANELGVPMNRISDSDGSLIGSNLEYDGINITIDHEYGFISVDNIPDFTANVPDEVHFYTGQSEKEVFENFGLSRKAFRHFYYEYDNASMIAGIDRVTDESDHITLSKSDENLGMITFAVDAEKYDEGWKVTNMRIQISHE